MSELGSRIAALVAQEGPMPLEHFMALALGDPRHGYYMTRDPFGAAGDFITAPEISQMFGELIGLWAAESWMQMGSPARLQLIELGPGRGTLMADALRAAHVAPRFREALEVHLVETSPVLAAAQRERLASSGLPATWHAHLSDVPEGPSIIIANEFFDALPVRQYQRTPEGWRERLVGLDAQGALAFGLAPSIEPAIQVEAQPGAVLEVGAVGHRIMLDLAARLARFGGAALAIDYGHGESRIGETLQALQAHRAVDPLAEPGEADLTTHVDFAALARAARAGGACAFGPIGQGEFLQRLGIVARAEALKRNAAPAQVAAIDAALHRLTATAPEAGAGPKAVPGMGALFKVLAVVAPAHGAPAGFRPEEERA